MGEMEVGNGLEKNMYRKKGQINESKILTIVESRGKKITNTHLLLYILNYLWLSQKKINQSRNIYNNLEIKKTKISRYKKLQ